MKKNKLKKTTTKKKSYTKKSINLIKNLELELTDLKNKNIRLLAEFDNYKKRNELEKNKLIKYEGQSIIKTILPILDDLDRTLQISSVKDNEAIYNGINMILDKIKSVLDNIGVTSYNSVNKEFDIDLHEAIMTKTSKKKKNIVLEEYEKGYKYHDKVIRHAKVIVGK